MKDDAHRIAKYVAKYVPTTVGLKLASQLVNMNQYFSGVIGGANGLVELELDIQGLLNGEADVETVDYPFYYNFGREVWKRTNAGISGDPLATYTCNLIAKYVDYGFDEAVLIKIALDKFAITCAPAGS